MSPDPTPPGYEILGLLAQTATVDVYRARALPLNREVAVKILRVPFVDTDGSRRFLEGVRIQASLHHPGIPSALLLGELPDGRPFLVMELIRGLTLDGLLRERPDPSSDLSRFVRVFRQACEAVGFAHSLGIVHRDVKSRNVMIGERGQAQVISWSLAYILGELTQEVLARSPYRAGTVMGTPAFMPPEQARGERADERSDVFGLGGILCHILTGEPPFRGTQAIDLIQTAASGDLRDAFARLDACGAPAELVALCKHCLDPNPANRPADGAAVARLVNQITP